MLIHYVIVRRDLPLGVLAAMVTHAAAESAAEFQYYMGSECDRAYGKDRATAVVLGVESEEALEDALTYLDQKGILFEAIYESHGAYANQLMSVGIVHSNDEKLRPLMKEFDLLS